MKSEFFRLFYRQHLLIMFKIIMTNFNIVSESSIFTLQIPWDFPQFSMWRLTDYQVASPFTSTTRSKVLSSSPFFQLVSTSSFRMCVLLLSLLGLRCVPSSPEKYNPPVSESSRWYRSFQCSGLSSFVLPFFCPVSFYYEVSL